MVYDREGKYGHLFMQETILPASYANPPAGQKGGYEQFGKRIHWVDSNNMPGAFQMNTSWWYKPNKEIMEKAGIANKMRHSHPYPEILGFYGSDPENPFDLGGEVELYIDDEAHIITKSTMVFIPPNILHCPITVLKVDRPIFHFSVVMNEIYTTQNADGTVREVK